mmetsp:Transcript_28184/g.81526  ORF Transcript_28184/g.81526 Transcript_28184/m.81526 type:complete len:246 (+) Transcript_28184:38-775(+)
MFCRMSRMPKVLGHLVVAYLLCLLPGIKAAAAAEDVQASLRRRRHHRQRQYVSTAARIDNKNHRPTTHIDGTEVPVNTEKDSEFWGRQLGMSVATTDTGDENADPPQNSLVKTYEDQFGTIVTIREQSITISYDCLEGYEDYPASTFEILPQYTEPMTPDGDVYVIAYNDKNDNDAPDPGEYTRFDYVLGSPDGAFYYCEIDFGEQSAAAAIADGSGASAADPNNLSSGCDSYPWSKLHPYSGTC